MESGPRFVKFFSSELAVSNVSPLEIIHTLLRAKRVPRVQLFAQVPPERRARDAGFRALY